MKIPYPGFITPDRIIYKTLLLLLVVVAFFSAIVFYSMYQNNVSFSEAFIDAQKELLERQVKKEEHELYEWEMAHTREHAHLIASLIQRAFAMQTKKKKIQNTLRIFMEQKNIRIIYIYDKKGGAVSIGIRKNRQNHIEMLNTPPSSISNLHRFSFPLAIGGNPPGGIDIYYSLHEIKEKIEEELHEIENKNYTLLKQQARENRFDLQHYFFRNFLLFLGFLLIMLIITAIIFTRHIHHPLQAVRENLQQFFAFFQDPSLPYQPKKIDGKDEFSQMSREINTNIQNVLKLYQDINSTQKEILITIGSIAEKHSLETKNHVQRVAGYSEILGRYFGLNDTEITLLKDASTLHDLGKVAIPDAILKKEDSLTPEEYEIMKTHTRHGYEMLRQSSRPLLKAAAIIAYEHHEHYDGSGYPRGLTGEAIHLYGRIVALADVYDALSSHRVYKKRWKDEDVFAFIRKEKGRHFDPKLVEIFFEHYDEFAKVRRHYYDNNE